MQWKRLGVNTYGIGVWSDLDQGAIVSGRITKRVPEAGLAVHTTQISLIVMKERRKDEKQ